MLPVVALRPRARSAALLALAWILSSCGPPAPRVEEGAVEGGIGAEEAVRAAVEAWDAAVNAGDADAVLALYDAEPTALPPDRPAATGREAVGRFWREFFARGRLVAENRTEYVWVDDDLAGAWGTWRTTLTPSGGGAPRHSSGKWLAVLERQLDGSWRIATNMWNLDQPPSDGGG